jgi:putative colanic acid biosynthesis UDP-glucose lipid carrier transferase
MYGNAMQAEGCTPVRSRRVSAAGLRNLVEGLLRASDVVVIGTAGIAAAAWRFGSVPMPEAMFTALILGTLLAANTLPLCQTYRADRLPTATFQLPRALLGWALTVPMLLSIFFAMKVSEEISRLWVGAWFLIGACGLVLVRIGARIALGNADTARSLVWQVAVVGLGEQLTATLHRFDAADGNARVAAVLDMDGALNGRWPAGVEPLHSLADLEERIFAGEVDTVVLAMPCSSDGHLERALRTLRHLPVDVSLAPALPDSRVPVLGVARINHLLPVVRLLERPLDGWRYVLKSTEDRILAGISLLLTAPAMLVLALAVKLDSPGPVFYRQRRYGLLREPISVLKFRTMYAGCCDAPNAPEIRQATRHDPRITRLGCILRRTSLDELPQLFNVLAGEMSLVGPRPHAVAHDQYYANLVDDYIARHRVKPGITGWAQVHGFRGEIRSIEDMKRRIELDNEYIEKWSLCLDMRIMLRTMLSIPRDRSAF